MDKEGPDRQRQDIAAFCSRFGLNHVAEYFECFTGTVDTALRPKFMQMVEEILKRRAIAAEIPPPQQPQTLLISAIVIESCDRLARTLEVQEAAIRQLRKAGIKLYICRNGTMSDYVADAKDPVLNLCRQMMGAVAEFEKANMCHRLQRGRLNVRAKTGRCEGRKAFGTRPGEDTILAIMQQRKKDRDTYKEIASSLNANRFCNRSGDEWTWTNIRSILNPKSKRIRSLEAIVEASAH